MKEGKHNYLALKKLAAKLKSELSILDYFFSLEKKGLLKYEGKIGKEVFFGFLDQRTGSIALNEMANVWFDHSSGEGGDIIKAVQVYENVSFSDAIQKLSSKTPVEFAVRNSKPQKTSTYQILKEIPIAHPALNQYILYRGLDQEIVGKFCKEIHWVHNENAYFGIGLKNDAGGWSVRSKLFKGNLLSSGISTVKIGARVGAIKIFEGMFDFLSFIKLYPESQFIAKVLNSTANLSTKLMEELHQEANDNGWPVHLYLDRDEAGDEKTKKALGVIAAASDVRNIFEKYSDLNELIMQKTSEEYKRKR